MKFLVLILFSMVAFTFSASANEESFYAIVSPSSTSTETFVPADGEKVKLRELGGNGGAKAFVSIDFDGDFIFATQGDAKRLSEELITGDGVKAFTITLDNTDSSTHTIGGYYIFDTRK